MQHDLIEPPGEEVGPSRDLDCRVEDAISLALRRAQLRRVGLGPFGGSRQATLADHLVDARQKILGAAPPDGDRRDDGDAKLGREAVEIDFEPATAGNVEHIEREDHRPADALQLEREAQSKPQIGRVGDADENARDFLAFDRLQNSRIPGPRTHTFFYEGRATP